MGEINFIDTKMLGKFVSPCLNGITVLQIFGLNHSRIQHFSTDRKEIIKSALIVTYTVVLQEFGVSSNSFYGSLNVRDKTVRYRYFYVLVAICSV